MNSLKLVGVVLVLWLSVGGTGVIKGQGLPLIEYLLYPGLRPLKPAELEAIWKVDELLANLEDAGAIKSDLRLQLADLLGKGKLYIDEGLETGVAKGVTRHTHEPISMRYIALAPSLFKEKLSVDPRAEYAFINLVVLAGVVVHEMVHYNQSFWTLLFYPHDREYEAYTREIAFLIRVYEFLPKYRPKLIPGFELSEICLNLVRKVLKDAIASGPCSDGPRESGQALQICNVWKLAIGISPRLHRVSTAAAITITNNVDHSVAVSLVEVKNPSGRAKQLYAGEMILGEGAGVTFSYEDTGEAGTYCVKVKADSVEFTEEFRRLSNLPPRPALRLDYYQEVCGAPGCKVAIQLDASVSEDPDGRIVEYSWDFGDGSKDKGPENKVSHQYGVGKYKVTLTVTDNEGLSSTLVVGMIEVSLLLTPSKLKATAVGSSRIDLSWEDNSDNEKGFEIERKRSGEKDFTRVTIVSANTKSYSDTGLSCGKYYYRVRAYNDAGHSDWSNEADGTTPKCCGNETCESGENSSNCPQDCPGACCGNGRCETGETCSSCPQDCGRCPYCGDGICQSNESCSTCSQDCGRCPYCGDGICQSWNPWYESCSSCPRDCGSCGPVCGNGWCETGENPCTCPRDCWGCCGACGGDPPIWGHLMAFPTPERFLGQDLNRDEDLNDTVLRYMNLLTGEVVNTGAIVSGFARAISVYENTIVFVGVDRLIHYYKIDTGELMNLEVKGYTPHIYDELVVFSENGQIHCYDLRAKAFKSLMLEGYSPTIYENLIVYYAKGTIWYYDLVTGLVVNTGIIGVQPYLQGQVIALVLEEVVLNEDLNKDGDKQDKIIGYYDIGSGVLVVTEAIGYLPAICDTIIVFATDELAVGEDLNGDGKIKGSVIRYYDMATGKVVNTGILGTEPAIHKKTITYYVWEDWLGKDLTGDGDMNDPVVCFLRIDERTSGCRKEASEAGGNSY